MNKTMTTTAVAAAMTIAGTQEVTAEPAFKATSVVHTGTLHVDATPEHAFQLFNAPGERLWVPGWDPVVLRGGDGREKGSVWVTDVEAVATIWVVVDYDPESLHARYARISPDSSAGTVEVFARSDRRGGTDVDVSFELTALNDAGNRKLADFDAEFFSQMMFDWEQLIREANIEFPVRFDEQGATR